jgi:hypothetical protein
MKRNEIIDIDRHNKLNQHQQCIAFHEAGHAAAIYLNNKARNLPPVFFQIVFKDLSGAQDYDVLIYKATHYDSIARVEGGRLIELLPYSIDDLDHKLIKHNQTRASSLRDYLVAFEADVINLLAGPLAEAKHVHKRDDELFNHQLVDLKSLINYGGGSDLALVRDYLECFSANKQIQDQKLAELFALACDFIREPSNWKAITKLANYILDSNKNIISCEEVVSVIES